MKKSLLALAVLGAFAGAASAQSSVTLYGVADANITAAKGGGERLWSLGSGGLNGSRFGLRGSEDLGGGFKANFALENGYNIDTGATAQGSPNPTLTGAPGAGSRLFGRQAWVGVGGSFGEIRLGRQYTPIGALTDELGPLGTKGADLFAVGQAAQSVASLPAGVTDVAGGGQSTGNRVYRTDNAINYLSPNIAGLTINAQYSFQYDGNELNKPNNKVGRQFGINVLYKGGPFQGGLAYHQFDDASFALAGDQEAKGYLAYVGFTFGGITIKGAYDRMDLNTAKDRQTYGLAVEAPLGPVNLAVGLAQAKDSTALANREDDALLANVQVVYELSKRTALYTFYTHVKNDDQSSLGFNGPSNDKNSNQFQLGIRHRF